MQFAPLPPPFPNPASLPWERSATRQRDVMVMTGPVTGVIKASPGISAMKEERHYPLCADGAAPPAHWLAVSDPAAAGHGPESAPPPPKRTARNVCLTRGPLRPRQSDLFISPPSARPWSPGTACSAHSLAQILRFFFGPFEDEATGLPGDEQLHPRLFCSRKKGNKKKTGRETARFEKVAEG